MNNFRKGNLNSSVNSSKPGHVLDNAVWHSHLPAEGGQEHHHLDGIDIVGNYHQLNFLLLDKGGHVVDSRGYNRSYFLNVKCVISAIKQIV